VLRFDEDWRFESPGPIAPAVVGKFQDLIDRICSQGHQKTVLEYFKASFGMATGTPHYPSSDVGWAHTDLWNIMDSAEQNAPLFIEAFYNACENLREDYPDLAVPTVSQINRILSESGAGYQVDPPKLIETSGHTPVVVPDQTSSLDARAKEMIEMSLKDAERELGVGHGRQAVQELLWLLETITTAFRNPEILQGSVQDRYFNEIIRRLRREHGHHAQIFQWMLNLHGYLSSPTGGGVRHGRDVTEGVPIKLNEARLFCNLIRSYVTFLILEHDGLSQQTPSEEEAE